MKVLYKPPLKSFSDMQIFIAKSFNHFLIILKEIFRFMDLKLTNMRFCYSIWDKKIWLSDLYVLEYSSLFSSLIIMPIIFCSDRMMSSLTISTFST